MPEIAALTAALRAMLPAGAGVGGARISDSHVPWPGEDLQGAVPRRLAEFAAGRTAARAALQDIGVSLTAIPIRADRSPTWPDGVSGSITHAGNLALAAAARAPVTVGIDIEPDADLPTDTLDLILSPTERAAIPDLRAARVAFSAKESFFKAQFPQTGAMIGFDAVTVTLSDRAFCVTLNLNLPGLPAGTVLQGAHAGVAGHVLTALVIA